MQQNDTVVLAGGTELTNIENIKQLESAGYLVITANNLDYALAAGELFKPKILVIDADQLGGDVGTICRTLINRPNHPTIYILSTDKKAGNGKLLPTKHIEYLQKPAAIIAILIERIERPHRKRPLRQRRRLGAALIAAVGIIVAAAVTLTLLFGRPPADNIIIDDAQVPLAQQQFESDDTENN